ncbi:MAG: hypothetical protein WBW40_01445, partial [Thermoplasmata archaeon]
MTPGRRWRKPSRRFWRWVSVAIPIGVVVFLLVGFWNWIPVTYSDYVVAPGAGCAPYACFVRVASTSFPSGENLTVHWVDDSGGSVGFLVLGL